MRAFICFCGVTEQDRCYYSRVCRQHRRLPRLSIRGRTYVGLFQFGQRRPGRAEGDDQSQDTSE